MSHYDVLGVEPSVDEETLHRAYVALARRHHPDRAGGDAVRMRAINEAWATLGDPTRRASYDRQLGAAGVHAHTPRQAAPSRPRPWVDADWPDWEGDDLAADLADDRPVRATVEMPRWLSLVPVALLAAAAGTFVVSVVFASEPLFALAGMLAVLAGIFFVSAPFLALLASRRGELRREE